MTKEAWNLLVLAGAEEMRKLELDFAAAQQRELEADQQCKAAGAEVGRLYDALMSVRRELGETIREARIADAGAESVSTRS